MKKQRHHFPDQGPYSQSYGFSSSYVWMWELDNRKDWVLKNWCLWTIVLEKTLEYPLDRKEIKPLNPKRNQPWIFIERTVLKLKLQSFGDLMRIADSLEKTLMLAKMRTGGEDRGWDSWMASPTQGTWVWANCGRWWRTGEPGVLSPRDCKESDQTERLKNHSPNNILCFLFPHR